MGTPLIDTGWGGWWPRGQSKDKDRWHHLQNRPWERASEKRGQRETGNSRVMERSGLREKAFAERGAAPRVGAARKPRATGRDTIAAWGPPLTETCTSSPPPGLATASLLPERGYRSRVAVQLMNGPETPDPVSLPPVTTLKRVRPPKPSRAERRPPQRFPWRNETAVFAEPRQGEWAAGPHNRNP